MEEQLKPSLVTDIDLPVKIVELEKLLTKDGGPVRVQCESIPELKLSEILKGLPGDSPPPVKKDDAPQDPEQILRALDRFGPQLIEAGTSLTGPAGTEIRPAFWFTTPRPGSIPGRLLHEGDKALLVTTIMRMGGYLGGAAGASFHGGQRGGTDGGLGAVAPGAGNGDPAAPAAQPGAQSAAGTGV